MGPLILHASAVAFDGRGCLIIGAAGSGKSTLAMEMIAVGGQLVADDRTVVDLVDGALMLDSPAQIAGQIEVRGIGLLSVPHASAHLALIVDLDRRAPRLPPPRFHHLLGQQCPVILAKGIRSSAAAVSVLLRNIASNKGADGLER